MILLYLAATLIILGIIYLDSRNPRVVFMAAAIAAVYCPMATRPVKKTYAGGSEHSPAIVDAQQSSAKTSYTSAAQDVVAEFCNTLPNKLLYKLSYNAVFKCVDAALAKVVSSGEPIKLGNVRTMYGLVLDRFADNKIAVESLNPNTHIMRSAAFLSKYSAIIDK
jgi:hypothetical protein